LFLHFLSVAMAALAAADTATDNSFNRLFTSSTLTFSGYNPTQTAADGGVVAATTIPATLATATGSSPAPLSFSTSTKASTASPTAGHGSSSNDSRAGSNSNVPAGKNVNNLLIALGCTGMSTLSADPERRACRRSLRALCSYFVIADYWGLLQLGL
jgi:hypothetical protein